MLTLYHMWTSTCSKKVRITLAEKNLPWESRLIRTEPAPENLEPWYLGINPNGVVPSLDHDGRIVIESCVILEYLDDVFPEPPLRPADCVERARMRVWLERSENVVHRYINVLSHNRFMARALGDRTLEQKLALAGRYPRLELRLERQRRYRDGVSPAEEGTALALLAEFMDDMEASLSGQPWLAGADYSLADIAISPFIERFAVNGLDELIDWSARPAVGDWWQRISARPAWQTGMALHMAGVR